LLKEPLKELSEELKQKFEETEKNKDLASFVEKNLISARNNEIKQLIKETSKSNDYYDPNYLVEQSKIIYDKYKNQIINNNKILTLSRNLIFVDEFTAIGLAKKLLANNYSLSICEPEGHLINSLTGTGDKKHLIYLLLKSYSNEDFSYITTRSTIDLDKPNINILLSIQPYLINKFFSNQDAVSSGLVPRFIPIFCNYNRYQPNYYKDSDQKYLLYKKFIKLICQFDYNHKTPLEFYLTDDAKKFLDSYRDINIVQFKNQYKFIESFLSKLPGTVVRISVILKIADMSNSNMIDTCYIEQASKICSAIVPHVDYAMNPIGLKSIENDIRIKEWIIKNNISEFQIKDISQNIDGLNKAKILPAIEELVHLNYIAKVNFNKISPDYVVHSSLINNNYYINNLYHKINIYNNALELIRHPIKDYNQQYLPQK
jgi:hypothetical protein